MNRVPKLLYLITEDWFFCSHFLPMARAARDMGLEVVVATRCREHREAIESHGIRVIALEWRRSAGSGQELSRRGLLRWGLAGEFMHLVRLLRRERPDILHCIALKPVILGGLAAKLARRPHTVCAVTGLGRTWIGTGIRTRLFRRLILAAMRLIAYDRRVRVLVENRDHEQWFAAARIAPSARITRVPGAGVDMNRYRPSDRGGEAGEVNAALVARLIPIKGVELAVEAVKRLSDRGVPIRLTLVGAPDPDHAGSISEDVLERWSIHPAIRWLGRQDDIVGIWADADIALLPALGGDGLPKSLIEAAACGKPIVTTDTDGCRETVQDGVSGVLVPPGDVDALADAIERLVGDPALRLAMGQAGRVLAEEAFAEDLVAEIVSKLYASLLRERYGPCYGSRAASRP